MSLTAESYRGMDRAALDRAYDPFAQIAHGPALLQTWAARSEEARARLHHRADVAYGASPAERLDIFFARRVSPAPIHLYFHGGGWRLQDKRNASFLAEAFVERGIVFLAVNYGLCPAVTMDEIVRQGRTAAAWAYREAESFGGDRNRIVVSGQSAGAHIALRVLEAGSADLAGVPGDLVKAAIGVSGVYDLTPMRLSSANADLRLDEDCAERNSPARRVPSRQVPLLLAVGQEDGDEFRRQTADYSEGLTRAGYEHVCRTIGGRRHLDIVDDMGAADSELGRLIVDTIGRV